MGCPHAQTTVTHFTFRVPLSALGFDFTPRHFGVQFVRLEDG
jgi:hypothetical protein